MTKKEITALLQKTSGKFYVYSLCSTTGEPFYIGKGTVNGAGQHRLFSHWNKSDSKDKNKIKHKIINDIKKDGKKIDYKILKFFENEKDAFDEEIVLIAHYGRINNGTGILSNLDDGGRGCYGAVFTDEMRLKQSKKISNYYKEHPEARIHNSMKTKEWNKTHVEERLERQRRSAEANGTKESRDISRKAILLFYEEHPEMKEHLAQKTRDWIKNNPEKEAERRAKAKTILGSDEERKKNSERVKKWFKDNPEKTQDMLRKSAKSRGTEKFKKECGERKIQWFKDHPEGLVAMSGKMKQWWKDNSDAREENNKKRAAWRKDNPKEAAEAQRKSMVVRNRKTTIRLRCLDFIEKHRIDIVAPSGRESISIWMGFENELYELAT